MNNAISMLDDEAITKNPLKKYNKQEQAEKSSYKTKDGVLYIPSRCMKACILNASAWYKSGKKAVKPIIAGTTRIEPSELLLLDEKDKKIKEYETDLRTVVIQRNRIVRARPLIRDWRVKFDLVYNEELINPEIIRNILEEAGERVGVLDNRPQKYGENGTFELVKFLPIDKE